MVANEQLGPELRLQPGGSAAEMDGRLRDRDPGGGERDAAGLGRRHETLDLLQREPNFRPRGLPAARDARLVPKKGYADAEPLKMMLFRRSPFPPSLP